MYATVGMRRGIMIDVVASDDRPGLRRSRQHDGYAQVDGLRMAVAGRIHGRGVDDLRRP